MISDPLNIVDYVKQGADAFAVINRQRHLTDPDQIAGNGVVHEIDLFFHFINLKMFTMAKMLENLSVDS